MPTVGLDPAKTEMTYRGQTFKLQEVEISVYDEALTKATTRTFDADGQTQEAVDQPLLIRLLLLESLTEPRVTSEDLSHMGTRLVRQLERDVRDLHFDVEPETPEAKRKRAAKAAEDDDPPNVEA
jgi:hypothetical protein